MMGLFCLQSGIQLAQILCLMLKQMEGEDGVCAKNLNLELCCLQNGTEKNIKCLSKGLRVYDLVPAATE